jgi:hypothetical protein
VKRAWPSASSPTWPSVPTMAAARPGATSRDRRRPHRGRAAGPPGTTRAELGVGRVFATGIAAHRLPGLPGHAAGLLCPGRRCAHRPRTGPEPPVAAAAGADAGRVPTCAIRCRTCCA